jgi:hypothetical protein
LPHPPEPESPYRERVAPPPPDAELPRRLVVHRPDPPEEPVSSAPFVPSPRPERGAVAQAMDALRTFAANHPWLLTYLLVALAALGMMRLGHGLRWLGHWG